jgi:aspartate 1-decarboxylase
MLIEILKSKLHRATITGAELSYEGSLAVDPELIAAADMIVGQKVQVVNLNNGARLETYLIKGQPGEVCLNGPAARLGLAGDLIIIIAYATAEPEEAASFKPKVVLLTDHNKIKQIL